MKSFFHSLRAIQTQYLVFIITIVVTIIVTQAIIQYDLGEQNEDARLINLAGRQRMLSQRISKLTLYIQQDFSRGRSTAPRLDTLSKLVDRWEKVHFSLLEGNDDFDLSGKRSEATDRLLRQVTPQLEAITVVCRNLIKTPTKETATQAAEVVEQHELGFLMGMDHAVNTFQLEAEQKLEKLKKIEFALAAASLIILIMEFGFIFVPMIRRLKKSNYELADLNKELTSINEELQATEEELRTNLDYTTTLQENLASREKQFREVLENATDMIYELNENGKFSYVNPVMENICEFSAEEFYEKHYWDLIHPDHRARVVEQYNAQRRRREETSYLEFPIISKNGFDIWVGQNVRMFFHAGKVVKVNVVARDVTVILKAREALEISEKKFRSLSENAPVGIYQQDVTGKTIFINKKWFEIVGLEESADFETRMNAIHQDDRDKVRERWQQAVARGEALSIEFRYHTPKKGITWVTNQLTPVFSSGNLAGFVGTMADVTMIQDAKHRAEEATLAKSQFLSMMSHEIRTPMNAVIGLTNLLLAENPEPHQLEHLKLLKFSGENLLTIINDILDFSKIEAGKITLETIPFNLKQHVENVVSMLATRAEEKGIRMQFEYDAQLPEVFEGDQVRIGQIITNLVSNAIKFTESGSVKVQISGLASDKGLYQVTCAVQDSGIGIESDKLNRIFESFSQANADTTRKYGGTGLGLSITRRLLHLMGSDIHVVSAIGKGSTFTFTLHLKEASLAARPSDAQLQNEIPKDIRVLLVEDNKVNQVVAANFLKRWGMLIEFANNGVEALEKLKSKGYNLVLMDLQMPEMDGYQATKHIRSLEDEYYKSVPIIALTASAMNDIKDKVYASGMTDYISKPFIPDELQSKILKHSMAPGRTVVHPKIDLTIYTEGDPDFTKELSGHLIQNLVELRDAAKQRDLPSFKSTVHKTKTTIGMVNDPELSGMIDDFKNQLESSQTAGLSVLERRLAERIDQLISTLRVNL